MQSVYIFDPHIQKLISEGIYKIVIDSKTGEALPIVRDIATGHFKAFAKQIITQGSNINPLFTPLNVGANFLTSSVQMYQTHKGFQKTYQMINQLQQSIGVLQGTMSLIGVGTIATVALSAVNLQQTLKLREDIKQLRLEVKDGFIDLKQALKNEKKEVFARIEQVAKDVTYQHHRTILAQAYGRFLQAVECIKDALKTSDINLRNAIINNAQKMLYDALADYKNPLLYDNSNTPGKLRRKECTWAIEQTLIMTYQLQEAYEIVCSRLQNLQQNINKDAVEIIGSCESETELDFLFPELIRIKNHDLLALKTWQNNTEYFLSLPTEDKINFSELTLSPNNTNLNQESKAEILLETELPEITNYKKNKEISHFAALKDELIFNFNLESRKEKENYIVKKSINTNKKALAPSNWKEIPNLTVANLYWYFKNSVQAQSNN